MLVYLGFIHTLKIIARTLSEVVNRKRLCGTNALLSVASAILRVESDGAGLIAGTSPPREGFLFGRYPFKGGPEHWKLLYYSPL